jgi:hypothetical protein
MLIVKIAQENLGIVVGELTYHKGEITPATFGFIGAFRVFTEILISIVGWVLGY